MIDRFLLGLLALSWIAVSGCKGDEAPQPAGTEQDATPVAGGTLVVAQAGDMDTFNPLTTHIQSTQEIHDLLFPLLVTADFDCKLQFEPGLATSWSWSDDGLHLTMKLRDDMVWSDGEAVNADDVLHTLELVRDPAVGCPRGPYLQSLDPEEPWARTDDHTVVFHFRERGEPTTMLAHVVAGQIIPEHAFKGLDRASLRGAEISQQPITSGPFKLASRTVGQQTVLGRNEQYTAGPKPYLDQVILRAISDDNSRILEFETGKVDMVIGVEPSDLERLRTTRPDMQIHRRGWRFLEYIGWNLQDPLLTDRRVRRALAHAIDVDTLMGTLLSDGSETYGRRATGTTTPEICDAVDETIVPLAFSPERARGLLAEAGWADGDGDGVLERDGKPFVVKLMYNAALERRAAAGTIIQSQLAQVGVQVTLEPVERNAVYERLRNRDFQAVIAGWSASLLVDPSQFWHSQKKSPFNYTGYANPEVDRLIDEGLATIDPAEAAPRWREMQRQIYEDQPYCFLYWIDEAVVFDGRVRDATPTTLSPFENLSKWWIPEELRKYPAP